MPKFFVISDIHSYFDEMKKALDDTGFDPNNEDHWLVSCGDEWDRGTKPVEVMKYLCGLPRKIIVRGNHTDLFVECCERGYPEYHDYSNGTVDTIERIGIIDDTEWFETACNKALARTHIFLEEMVDYFETKNYIFVHGWIPLLCDDSLPKHYTRGRLFKFNPEWRTASKYEWEQARWHNGMQMAARGFKPDKTVVCGHWHCSYGHMTKDGTPEFGDGANFEPFYGDGVIAIDRCTAYTGEVNVLVLEDEFLEG